VVNFCSPKSGLRTEMTNGILYLSSCMKSSLLVAFMIKFRQDFTEYKSSEKPMKTLDFSPLVLFLLHYEFIFTPMRVPWNFHICDFELYPEMGTLMSQFTPQKRAFMVSELLRSNNINLVRQCFTNEYPDVRCPSRIRT
jgi:hypothetical protein